MHGVIGYKFCWLLPSEDHTQGIPTEHESDETPIGTHESVWLVRKIQSNWVGKAEQSSIYYFLQNYTKVVSENKLPRDALCKQNYKLYIWGNSPFFLTY